MDSASGGLDLNWDQVLCFVFLDKTFVFHKAFLLKYFCVLVNPLDNLWLPSNAELTATA